MYYHRVKQHRKICVQFIGAIDNVIAMVMAGGREGREILPGEWN